MFLHKFKAFCTTNNYFVTLVLFVIAFIIFIVSEVFNDNRYLVYWFVLIIPMYWAYRKPLEQ